MQRNLRKLIAMLTAMILILASIPQVLGENTPSLPSVTSYDILADTPADESTQHPNIITFGDTPQSDVKFGTLNAYPQSGTFWGVGDQDADGRLDIVEDPDDTSNMVLRITDLKDPTTYFNFETDEPRPVEDTVFAFKLRSPVLGLYGSGWNLRYRTQGEEEKPLFKLNAWDNGNVDQIYLTASGTPVATGFDLETDTWYDFKIVFHYEAGTFDLLVNEEQVVSNVAVPDGFGDNIKCLVFMNDRVQDDTTMLYLDDLCYYPLSGVEEPTEEMETFMPGDEIHNEILGAFDFAAPQSDEYWFNNTFDELPVQTLPSGQVYWGLPSPYDKYSTNFGDPTNQIVSETGRGNVLQFTPGNISSIVWRDTSDQNSVINTVDRFIYEFDFKASSRAGNWIFGFNNYDFVTIPNANFGIGDRDGIGDIWVSENNWNTLSIEVDRESSTYSVYLNKYKIKESIPAPFDLRTTNIEYFDFKTTLARDSLYIDNFKGYSVTATPETTPAPGQTDWFNNTFDELPVQTLTSNIAFWGLPTPYDTYSNNWGNRYMTREIASEFGRGNVLKLTKKKEAGQNDSFKVWRGVWDNQYPMPNINNASKFTYEFDFKITSRSHNWMFAFNDYDFVTIPNVPDDIADIQTIGKNTWYRMSIEVDRANNTYSVYINNYKVLDSIAAPFDLRTTQIQYFEFKSNYKGVNADSSLFIDNFTGYPGAPTLTPLPQLTKPILTIGSVTCNSAVLNWTAATGGNSSVSKVYDVYRKNDRINEVSDIKLNTAPITDTTYTITGLSPNTTYSNYYVKATESAASYITVNSDMMSVTTLSDNARLSALTYTADSTSSITVPNFLETDNQSTNTYNVTLPIGTTSVTTGATRADSNASILMNPTNGALTFDAITGGTGTVTATVTAESGRMNQYVVNYTVPSSKKITVDTQSNLLISGIAGSTTFAITTANIANGTYAVTLNNAPMGVTVGNVTINNNSGTLVINTTSAVSTNNYSLMLTIDGTKSASFKLAVDPPTTCYYLENMDSAYYLMASGTNDNAAVTQTSTYDASKHFYLLRQSDGYYRIVLKSEPSKCLLLNTSNNVVVMSIDRVVSDPSLTNRDKWNIMVDEGAYVFTNKVQTLAMSNNGSSVVGTSIKGETYSNASKFKWTLRRAVTSINVMPKINSTNQIGDVFTLSCEITPLNAYNKDVTWSTSNANVATISGSGLSRTVTVVGNGTAVITATSVDGQIALARRISTEGYGAKAAVEHYYDNGYQVRYGGDPANEISDRQNWVSNVFLSQFNLSISHTTTPQLFTTLPDLCKTKRGLTVNTTTINQPCPYAVYGATPDLNHNPICTDWLAMYNPFITAHPGDAYKPTVLWTGNKLFRLDGNNQLVQANRSYSWYNYGINMQDILTPTNRTEEERYVLLHEEAHQFGAPDHYCQAGDDYCGNYRCWFHYPQSGYTERCTMGMHISDINSWDQDDLFCKHCANDILNHIADSSHN